MGYLDVIEKANADLAAKKPVATGKKISLEDKLRGLDRVDHYSGSGSSSGPIGIAVRNALSGNLTPPDIVTLTTTNNYGGPVASYKSNTPKSQQDPEVIEAIKKATVIGKKNATQVYQKGMADFKKQIGNIMKGLTVEKVKQAVSKVTEWDDAIKKDVVEEVMGYNEGKKLLAAPSTLSSIGLLGLKGAEYHSFMNLTQALKQLAWKHR